MEPDIGNPRSRGNRIGNILRSSVEQKITPRQENMFLSHGVLLVEHKIVAYVDDDAGIAAEGLSLKQMLAM